MERAYVTRYDGWASSCIHTTFLFLIFATLIGMLIVQCVPYMNNDQGLPTRTVQQVGLADDQLRMLIPGSAKLSLLSLASKVDEMHGTEIHTTMVTRTIHTTVEAVLPTVTEMPSMQTRLDTELAFVPGSVKYSLLSLASKGDEKHDSQVHTSTAIETIQTTAKATFKPTTRTRNPHTTVSTELVTLVQSKRSAREPQSQSSAIEAYVNSVFPDPVELWSQIRSEERDTRMSTGTVTKTVTDMIQLETEAAHHNNGHNLVRRGTDPCVDGSNYKRATDAYPSSTPAPNISKSTKASLFDPLSLGKPFISLFNLTLPAFTPLGGNSIDLFRLSVQAPFQGEWIHTGFVDVAQTPGGDHTLSLNGTAESGAKTFDVHDGKLHVRSTANNVPEYRASLALTNQEKLNYPHEFKSIHLSPYNYDGLFYLDEKNQYALDYFGFKGFQGFAVCRAYGSFGSKSSFLAVVWMGAGSEYAEQYKDCVPKVRLVAVGVA